jgi:hypothetical protein
MTMMKPIPYAQSMTDNPGFPPKRLLCSRHDTPSTDDVVGVTSEQSLTISGPSQRDRLGLAALLANGSELNDELVNLALLLEVEDDDVGGSGSAEPVSVGREDKGVDLVAGVEGVQVLGLVEVPEHGGTVLATGGAEGTIGGDGDGVDVSSVADVVSLELAGREFPNLEIESAQTILGLIQGFPGEKKRFALRKSGQLVIGCLMASRSKL